MGRWLLGAVILLIVGLLYGMMTAEPRIADMENNIRADLSDAGHDWATVEMTGNLALITGSAPSAAAQQAAINVAEDARCTVCKDKHKWHDVADASEIVEIAALPAQSPYTFSALKSVDGNVVLSGFVPSEEIRGEVLRDAVDVFGNDRVTDASVQIADGAPDASWSEVIRLYLRKLARLDKGRLFLEGTEGSLHGETSDGNLQAELYSDMQSNTPVGYNFVGSVTLPGGPVQVVGQSNSQTICQGLLNDLRRGRKVNFEAGGAAILGVENLDLLGDLASATRQCPDFRIAINGYTSSEGDPAMNQKLSEDRANAVLAFLNTQGEIERERLQARGFGSSDPIADNDTVEGREQNRRIEFILSRVE